MQHPTLLQIVRHDSRYPYEAYLFIFEALAHTQRRLGRGLALEPGEAGTRPERHVSGRELLDGIRDFARQEFGLMAPVVFQLWNIHRTDDFGEIVFNLIDANLLSKNAQDSRGDFHELFNLREALTHGYSFTPEAGSAPKRGTL